MNTHNLARATFVLERSTARDLTYLSRRMGRSRSDLVREILSPTISDLAEMLRNVPERPEASDLDSFRTAALSLMGDAYAQGLDALSVGRGAGHE